MHSRTLVAFVLCLVTKVSSQLAQYNPRDTASQGILYSVNIPSSTAASKSGPVFFQLLAPPGTQWLGLGQGSRMSGANIFIMYAASSQNVTLSPRSGTGELMPKYNPNAQLSLLDGSGVSPDGTLTANVRCDNCLSWNSGTMDPTSTKSSWIWAVKRGDAVNSGDSSQDLSQHDEKGTFLFDLQAGTGGDSSNPFFQAATNTSNPSSASASASTAMLASTSLLSAPTNGPSRSPSFSSSSSSGSEDNTIREAHGIIMAGVFITSLPLSALTIYLSSSKKVPLIHAPLQILNVCFLIAGLALGVILARHLGMVDGYHQIIGYIVVGMLIVLQPALGFLQHVHYRKLGTRSIFGQIHRSLGRIFIVLGILNGGLGLHMSGPIGSVYVSTWAVIAYSVVAGVVGLGYLVVVMAFKKRQEKKHRHRLAK